MSAVIHLFWFYSAFGLSLSDNMILVNRLLICAGLLLSSIAHSSGWPDVPVPEGVSVTQVSEDMVFNGVPMKIFSFEYLPGRQKLLDFYRNSWREEEVEFKEHEQGQWVILSAPHDKFYVTVQVSQLGNTGYAQIGISNWSAVSKKSPDPGTGFPRLPDSLVVNDIRASDSGRRSRTLLVENGHSIASNYRYYMGHFQRQHWNLVRSNLDVKKGAAAITVARDDREMEIVLTEQGRRSHIFAVEITH